MNHSIFTVADLTKNIKSLLEQKFTLIWITGEISNFKIPTSGHYYFTLKDDRAQISAVMFRGRNRLLKFAPEDGMKVIGLGSITVYEPRGNYQILFETLEPKGVGALQIAFEQLKARLAAEGLFNSAHKRPLPLLPFKVGLITSPTGAVVHDFMDIAARRFPGINIAVIPVKVQGDGAAADIVAALALADAYEAIEVIVIARGGGSLEDLQAFNTEAVARAIYACKTPIVSAIGHETDVTIADFVADLRAPTPSAAAELVVPKQAELRQSALTARNLLEHKLNRRLAEHRHRLSQLTGKLANPKTRIRDLRLRLDDFTMTLQRAWPLLISRKRERLNWIRNGLYRASPLLRLRYLSEKLANQRKSLAALTQQQFNRKRAQLNELMIRIGALDPAAILKRGYSIARALPEGDVIRDPRQVAPGQKISITMEKGTIISRVEE